MRRRFRRLRCRVIAISKILRSPRGAEIAQALEDQFVAANPTTQCGAALAATESSKRLRIGTRGNASRRSCRARHARLTTAPAAITAPSPTRDARQQDGGVADPDIVADDDVGHCGDPRRSRGHALAVALVIFRAIGLKRSLGRRPIGSIAAAPIRTELAMAVNLSDHGVGDLAVLAEIGVVAERGIFDARVARGIRSDRPICASRRRDRFMDDGFRDLAAGGHP